MLNVSTKQLVTAPEILLAVIETVTTLDDEPVEGLGPSCIVGSAAFNLLVISAKKRTCTATYVMEHS